MRTLSLGGVPTRTYHYNGKGERVKRVVDQSPASNLLFVYDEAGHLLGEYTEAGARVAEYVWMGDMLVAVLKSHDGTSYQYVETDHLGTPRAVINPVTNVTIWRWDITYTAFTTNTAFGEHTPDGNPDGNGFVYALALRYPGQYFDGVGPFFYNYFRDYDAATGRYLQPDPIGLAGGMSMYGYVGGAPLTDDDPYGLSRRRAYAPMSYSQGLAMQRVDTLTREIRQWDPNFRYVVVGPPGGVRYSERDVWRLQDVLAQVKAGPKHCPLPLINPTASPAQNYQRPTNPPSDPPLLWPIGWQVRIMRGPTAQYPNGYWSVGKPMPQGGWQRIDPSTMKPGSPAQTHIPLPPPEN
jgi:RHS repeat-associated protein